MKKKFLVLLLCVAAIFSMALISCREEIQPINITLNYNNGSEATVQQANPGEAFGLPTPTRDGYTFEGWYTSSDFGGSAVTSVTANEDTQVYAKWEKVYTLSLDLNGGTLSAATLTFKAGENIYTAVSALAPTRADSMFGEWLLDGEPITESTVMRAEDMTLTARYRVKYTVEVYLQNEAQNGYVPGESIVDYAYEGETVTPKKTVNGYTEVNTADSVSTLVMAGDASKNLFKAYYDRATYTLTFVSNFPDGSQNQTKTESLVYGVEKDLPFVTFEMQGYYLEGWATAANGEIAYFSHIMDENLFNAEAPAVEKIKAEGNITLYAVWSRGYTDLFGGEDIIYVSAAAEKTVYLKRGETYFEGRLRDDLKSIRFYDASGDQLYSGQLNPDGMTFLYNDVSRSEITATLFEFGVGVNENIWINFDSANGLTYTVKGENGITTESTGTYVFDENDYYIVTFTQGELAGTTMTMIVGRVTVGGTARTAFQVRNEEEFAMGQLVGFVLDGDAIVVNVDGDGNPYADITLNGFGVAYFNAGSNSQNFYYRYDKEKQIITLTSSSGSVAGVLKLTTMNGELGYIIYDEATDVSYDVTGGGTLAIDGMYTATYTNAAGNVFAGFYSTKTSKFGGTILTFVCDGKTYNFMITTRTQEGVIDPENPDTTTTVTITTAAVLGPVYAEYTYDVYGENGSLYTNLAPLFVFDGQDMTTVSIYGYTATRVYYKIANGTVVYHADTQTYTVTVTERLVPAEEVVSDPIDFNTIKSMELMLYTRYGVHFWLTYENTDNEETSTYTVYTGKNNSAITLTLTPAIAVYNNDGLIEMGTYTTANGVVTIAFEDRTVYITLDEETKTFADVTLPSTFTEIDKAGNVLRNQYLVIPSANAANIVYHIITTEGEQEIHNQYPGTRSDTGTTSLTGFRIYRFESDEKKPGTDEPLYSFLYISISSNYFFTYDEAYAGTYTSANGELNLDGFGFAATYGDSTGLDVIGMYVKDGDNVTISATSTNYYFHLTGSTCALRGAEYGNVYLVVDNQVPQSFYVELDGLGNAVVFVMETVDEESQRRPIDANATYVLDGTNITLTYSEGVDRHTLHCVVGVYQISSTQAYNALTVVHEEVISSYVNSEDWSILALNGDGTATKYLKNGMVETGTYSLVTDSLLYYVNSAATEAFIYTYNREEGTAIPQDLDVCAYYTEDLDSLLFSPYGFAIFNNSTRYYYTVENGNVTIYHYDVTDPNRNVYDYVKEDFGTFDDIKDYNGKKYYKNDGYAISFERLEENASKYPLGTDDNNNPMLVSNLVFAPSGAMEFSVTGTVTIGSITRSCTVVRALNEDGEFEFYFVVGTLYFDITVHYQGEEGSTYEITALSSRQNLPAYNYLYLYYYIYSMMGSNYASQVQNSYGVIQTVIIYDESSMAVESYMNAVFGESSGFIDANGELIASLEGATMRSVGNGAYIAYFTAADGYEYTLMITTNTSTASMFGTNSYNVYALVRSETLTTENGYTVEIDRIIASDSTGAAGSVFGIALTEGEGDDAEQLPYSTVLLYGNTFYYVVNDTDEDGNVTATTYYEIKLVEKSSGEIGGDETESNVLPAYESATVAVYPAQNYTTADGKGSVSILSDNRILMITIDESTLVVITESEYSEESGVYTLTASDGSVYTVKVAEDNVATITLVSTPAEEEETPAA